MRTIVVGVDGSGPSRQALAWAMAEAVVRRADVHVVKCWREPMLGGPGFSAEYETDMVFADAKGDLDAVVAKVHASHPSVHLSTALVDSQPAAAVVKRAQDADLVVVGARGNGGFLGLELGSVSARVARRSPVPVVVVRGEHDRSRNRTVLVGVDGSGCSRVALRWAGEWAKAHDKELHIVMAWNYLEPQGPQGPVPIRPEYTARDAAEALDTIVTEVLGPTVNPRITQEAVCDLPTRAVLERADDACLIVLGRHGKARWSPPGLGATALQVLHHAPCPVTIVPEGSDRPTGPQT